MYVLPVCTTLKHGNWFQASSTDITGIMDRNTITGTKYFSGSCSFTTANFPTTAGTYSYRVVITPGDVQPNTLVMGGSDVTVGQLLLHFASTVTLLGGGEWGYVQ
jgi:hypothetical protein